MHLMIINGSPRAEHLSNTQNILNSFCDGLAVEGATFERYVISDRSSWDEIREAYLQNTDILLAVPLYVENVPGLLLEFLETLPKKDENTRLSFLLQGGFAEASQLRCGEAFLRKLASELGVRFGGTLIKGDNFSIRFLDDDEMKTALEPFEKLGRAFVIEDGFTEEKIKIFAGAEYFPGAARALLGFIFRTSAKKRFASVAMGWGCTVPVDDRPWDREEK